MRRGAFPAARKRRTGWHGWRGPQRAIALGIVYKDKPEAARAFLDQYGNPFARIGLDAGGRAGIEWGITGVPETFVVDRHGVIRGHFGPLSPDSLVLEVLPAIARAAAE